jgi:transposase
MPAPSAILPETLAEAHQTIVDLHARVAWFEEQFRLLKHRQYGTSSETHTMQALLFNEAEVLASVPEEEPSSDESTPKVRSHRGRKPLPKDLPRQTIVHDLPDEQKVCACGCALHRIGEDRSEQLDIVPMKLTVIEHVRIKYACRACSEGIKTAPAPPAPIPGGLPTPNLIAHVIAEKYGRALPLYRLEDTFSQAGVPLSRTTLANWMIQSADVLRPLYLALREVLLAQPVIHADETPVQVLKEPGRAAQTTSFMWLYRSGRDGPPIALFEYKTTRAGAHPQAFLGDFTGYLQVDGYAAYERLPVTLVGCLAHARRYFDEALKAHAAGDTVGKSRAQQAIERFGALYAIERELTDANATAEERYRVRQLRAKPLLASFKSWLDALMSQLLPKSLLGKAVAYSLNQWDKLCRYLEDGRLSIDNNASERVIKKFVIGRVNWLFSATPAGAEASAILYSLVITAIENGRSPYDYLRHVLQVLPTLTTAEAVQALLPWNLQPDGQATITA